MPTLNELRNEWAEAVTAAKGHAGDQEAFDRAWAAAENARRAYENMEKAEASARDLGDRHPVIADIRNPDDARDVPNVSAEVVNRTPTGYIEIGKNRFVPYASRKSEGFARNLPAAVQLPSIIARYEPGSDLWYENQWQRRAFDIYMRQGRAGVREEASGLGAKDGRALLDAFNALQEDTDTEGGYLVPADERMELIHDPGSPGGVTRSISRVLQTSRDGGTFPSGTTVTWGAIAEEATPTDSDPAFAQVPFTVRKSGVNMTLSEELLADSAVDLPGFISQIVNETSGRYEDQQAVEGDGATEPLGLRTAGAPQGTISDITDLITLAAPTLLEINKAVLELPAQFRNARTRIHTTSSFVANIMSIAATGGQTFLQPDAQNAPGFRLLGIPIVMYDGTGWDNAGTQGADEEFGAIGDFGYYWFIDRLGVSIKRDDSVAFRSDQIAFKARKRYDSMFALANAFRIIKAASS